MKAVEVRALAGYNIWLRFIDGTTGNLDLGYLAGRGVFKVWEERAVFESVHVDQSGAITWTEDVDLCPDALYLRLTGKKVNDLFPSLQQAPVYA
jgi:hypothetical protein